MLGRRTIRVPMNRHELATVEGKLSSSGNLTMFAAIRRASFISRRPPNWGASIVADV